ncbi:hypothetical protein GWK36_12125 [Caldichromatium japonicum]|uniref:Glycosyltransferase n=1 Tax=Caldichromatium japonicum TaxID=2699430 RepID=A0A6G7VF45_9GAMM|nr:hypothetical protein [Caldichromatium japonicum]QIK38604.1 hypothetical protein GWK36_12125 [Caldichromatium japonicum]
MPAMRIVVSLTTLPERWHLLVRTLESIQRQTQPPAAIYLWLPRERFGEEVPQDYCFSGVDVRLSADLGPAMKLLPVLDIETDPETRIVTIDDDVEYPPGLIARLAELSNLYPDHALGFTGWVLDQPTAPTGVIHLNTSTMGSARFQPVHVLEGYRGVLYKRCFFDRAIWDHLNALSAFRWHDDILLSGYLGSRGIERLVCRYNPDPLQEAYHWKLNGDDIGLHTTTDWLEQGRSCVAYWLARDPCLFAPIIP